MEENIKINFLKKIWYSIAKPSKYEELRKLGVGKSIKYFFAIISIFAIILAVGATALQINIVNDAISYLDEKLPDFSFKNNKLTLENSEATILDDEKITSFLGNKIVINPLIEKNEAINQYNDLVTENNKVLIFLNEEYILITNKYNPENNNEDGIESNKYADVSSKYIKDTAFEYNKKSVIDYLKARTTCSYYIAQYFIIYFGTITIIYGFYIILISLSLWLVTKISKLYWTVKDSIINTIYASTCSIIVRFIYSIVSYFANFKISFMDVVSMLLIFIYLYLIIFYQKKNMNIKKEAEN